LESCIIFCDFPITCCLCRTGDWEWRQGLLDIIGAICEQNYMMKFSFTVSTTSPDRENCCLRSGLTFYYCQTDNSNFWLYISLASTFESHFLLLFTWKNGLGSKWNQIQYKWNIICLDNLFMRIFKKEKNWTKTFLCDFFPQMSCFWKLISYITPFEI